MARQPNANRLRITLVDLGRGVGYNCLMNATYESVMSSAMQLAPQDRCRVASSLWESTRSQVAEVDDDLESLLDQREAELEKSPSLEISHEAFLGHFSNRRRS